jgi:hypothetical protein
VSTTTVLQLLTDCGFKYGLKCGCTESAAIRSRVAESAFSKHTSTQCKEMST